MILVFDWETSGLLLHPEADSPKQPRAIEFGGALLHSSSGRVMEEFSILIDPEVQISEEITKITGLTNAALAGQPTFKAALPRLRAIFAQAECAIAHNLPFDKGILRGELARLGLELGTGFPWPRKELCTVGLYREQFGRNPKLIELYKHLTGKEYAQTHRGLDDVRALVEIVQHDRVWELL